MPSPAKYVPTSLKRALRQLRFAGRPTLFWARPNQKNWGDDLNPWLFEKLTGKTAAYCPHKDIPRLIMAGSILHCSGPHDICWGSGLLSRDSARGIRLKAALACRGRLTARALEENGNEPPNVFGDPGFLCADYVLPAPTKSAKIGIIPHYTDQGAGQVLANEMQAKLIPVSMGIEAFVRAVSEVEVVASSSLHGLICAESLAIPATWIRFSDNILGGDFKFQDYVSGTDREAAGLQPLDVRNTSVSLEELCARAWPCFDIATYRNSLMNAFPISY
jgi:pyruvyltransferase